MNLKIKIKAAIQLIRFELAFAAGLCVVIGGIIASGNLLPPPNVLLGFLCGFFIAGSANILNDFFDIEVDKENAHERPLPSGSISVSQALILSLVSALTGLFISLIISKIVFLFCAILWILSVLYNWKIKEKGFLGNLAVAVCVASTFLLGALIAGEVWNKYVWLLSLIAFFIDLGEEIAGDAMDIQGDKIRQTNSIAIKKGRDFALKISAASFGTVVLISLVPVFLSQMSLGYIILLLLADFSILFFTYKLLKSKTRAKGLQYMRAVYTMAYLGLAVIYMLAFTTYP